MTEHTIAGMPVYGYDRLLSLLNRLSDGIQHADDIDTAGDLIVECGVRLGFQRCRLWLLADDDRSMIGQSSAGDHGFGKFRGTIVSLDATPYTRDVLLRRQLQVFSGAELGPWLLPALLPDSGFQPPVGQWIHAPLWAGHHCWGILSFDNAELDSIISDVQRREVEIFCMFAAHALEQTQLLDAQVSQEREQHWNQQLMAITAQAQEATSLAELARIVVNGGIQLGFERARLWMLTEDQHMLVGTHQQGSHGLDRFVGMQMPCRESPYVQRTLAAGKPVRFHGLELGTSYLAQRQHRHGYRPPQGDWLSVPLIARSGTPIGLLTLDTLQKSFVIDDRRLAWMARFAVHISAALERARNTYERDWIEMLTDLQDVPSVGMPPSETAQYIVDMCLRLGFRRARIWDYDDQGNILVGTAQAGDDQIPDFAAQWMPLVASSYGQMEPGERDPIFKSDSDSERIRLEFFTDEIGVYYPNGEWVCVPLWNGATFLGILELDYGVQSHALFPGQRDLLFLLGRIVGQMVDHARLFEAEHLQRRRIAEQSATVKVLSRLDAAAQRLQQARELPEVYRALVEESLGYRRARLWMLEPDGKSLRCVSQHGCHRNLEGFRIPREKSTYARHVLLQHEPLVFHDRAAKPAFIDSYHEQLHFQQPVGPWICIPLANAAGTNIGMLVLDSLPDNDLAVTRQVLQLYAQHAEAALQRAQHRMEWRELHDVAYTLHQMQYRRDYGALLGEIARAGRKVLQADIVLIFPFQADTHTLQDPIHAGDVWKIGEYPLQSPNVDDNIVRKLVRSREPYYSEFALQDGRLSHLHSSRRSFTQRQEIQSFAGVPLMAQGQVLGVMCVNYRKQRLFSADDKLLIEIFAQMAGLVMTTVHLTRSDERRRIGRDLHDTVKNGLRALAGRLQSANHQLRALSKNAPDQQTSFEIGRAQLVRIQSDLHEANRISRVTFDDIKTVLNDLAAPDERPLKEQLLERLTQIDPRRIVQVEIDPDLPLLPLILIRALRNILAEAAVNAFEHGHATHFRVTVRRVRGRLYVTARDNGCGFDRARYTGPPGHMGLENMRTRALEIGGVFRLSSAPERATRLFLDLPLREQQRHRRYLQPPRRAWPRRHVARRKA